jgi:hypothetical protein
MIMNGDMGTWGQSDCEWVGERRKCFKIDCGDIYTIL